MIITGSSVLLEKKNNNFEKNNFKIISLKNFLDQIGNKLATNWQNLISYMIINLLDRN